MTRRLIFALVGLLLLAACTTMSRPSGDWIRFDLLEPGLAPNRALACAPDICKVTDNYTSAPVFSASAENLSDALLRLEPAAERRLEANGDIHIRWVAVTPTLRFRDDVDVLLRPSEGQTTRMAVYSRSRIGLSDLGTNARRIEGLTRQLTREVEA
jgi:uncharacterized protein (DUF1499 family)